MRYRSLIAGLILPTAALAQLTSFPKPNYFRETFAKSTPKVELQAPAKLKDFVQSGKLELSLKNYLELVVANNTDIQLQKLSIETPKNAIQRAFGRWDPTATAQFTTTRSTAPGTSQLEGASDVKTLSQPAQFSVSQLLPTGTTYTVGFNASKTTSNSSFSNYNPNLSSNLSVTFSQPLLQNRGSYVNRLTLMISRSTFRASEYSMRNQILGLVSAAENAYWDVISARESLRVAESAEDTANKFLDLQQRQLELGALSPLDIYAQQQQVAQSKVTTAQARFQLALVEDVLRKQMGADLDPEVRKLPILLTETVEVPLDSLQVDRDATIEKAMASRPDLKVAVQNLDADELRIQQSRNALLPSLALLGNYSSTGRGGIFYPRSTTLTPSQIAAGLVPTPVVPVPGGLTDAFNQLFGFGYSSYQLGLRLNFPIKSRAASADMADSVVRKRQDTLTLRTTQQQIRLDILNAATNVESSKESVKLAKVALEFAQKNLDAANKKYELGTGLQLDVSNAQDRLVSAESSVVTNQIRLRKNLISLLVVTGTLLDERGIVLQ
ncbi:MAG TPA: TolC family protein [Candidatus Acidoferrum sp.]|nr:TolC family protein [Candidatus Acidoferrum sp.]